MYKENCAEISSRSAGIAALLRCIISSVSYVTVSINVSPPILDIKT